MLSIPRYYSGYETSVILGALSLIPALGYLLFRSGWLTLIIATFTLKIGSWLLPMNEPHVKFLFSNPYIHSFLVLLSIWKAGNLVLRFRAALHKEMNLFSEQQDHYIILQNTCRNIFPDKPAFADILSQEFSVPLYALFLWTKQKKRPNSFSYSDSNGLSAIYITLFTVAIIETFCMHLILLHYGFHYTAIVLLLANIYTSLSFIAHLKAMNRRPVLLIDGILYLKYGLFANITLPVNKIKGIDIFRKPIGSGNAKVLKMALLKKIEPHNMRILLGQEITAVLFYGVRRKVTEIYFYTDEPDRLLDAVIMAKNQ